MMPTLGGARSKIAIKMVGTAAVVLLIIVTLVHSLARSPRRPYTTIPLRILPLGDSITWGWQPAHQINGTNGYRVQLLHELVRARYQGVEFVGTRHSGVMFNNENEGHSGLTLSKLQVAMTKGLAMRPNVILLHAGTNDLERPETKKESWADAPQRLSSLLDAMLKQCPDAVVIVAKLMQAQNTQAAANLKVFNDAIPGVVREKAIQGFKVSYVDQSVIGLNNEMIDSVHPTYAGYSHMGTIWFHGIKKASSKGLITPPVTPRQ